MLEETVVHGTCPHADMAALGLAPGQAVRVTSAQAI